MYLGAKDTIHYPFFKIRPLNTTDGAVIFDTQYYHATVKVGHGHDFFGELFRSNIVSFEFDT